MVNTLKGQRGTFYTMISIAKSTLYSLYNKHSGRITESRVCKILSSHLAKARIILPTSLRDGFKHIQDIEFNATILKTINFSAQKKNTTLPELREKPTTSHVLNHTKNTGKKITKQNVITGFCSEVLEEKMNSQKGRRNYALIRKFIALLKKYILNQG